MKLTLIVKKGQSGFLIGQIKELPSVVTQGLTIEELRENIADALEMYLEDARESYFHDEDVESEEHIIFS